MKNRLWILTAGIILVNFALVLFLRHSLPADLPLHINLDGSYAQTREKKDDRLHNIEIH